MGASETLKFLAIPVIYTVVVFIALPLNALAIWVMWTSKKNSMSVYMLNLAAADVCFLLCLPMKIVYHFRMNNWSLGDPLCRMYVAVFFTNVYTTPMFLAAISLDRYVAIVHPLVSSRWRGLKPAKLLCLVIWLISTASIVPVSTVTVLSYVNVTGGGENSSGGGAPFVRCYEQFTEQDVQFLIPYRLYVFFSLYYTSLVVTLFSYGNVLKILILNKHRQLTTSRNKKIRAAKMTVVSLIIYIVCLTPYNSTHVIGFIECKTNAFSLSSIALLRDITLCLSVLNSIFEPLLIYIGSSSFRKSLQGILKYSGNINQVSPVHN